MWSMVARMLSCSRRPLLLSTSVAVAALAGCHGFARKHEASKIPQYGTIDPHQAAELRKVVYPSYVIEAPDELEITAKPAFPDWPSASFVVRSDGAVDLGFAGDVFVTGLTLVEAEERIASQLTMFERARDPSSGANYRVSVRLASNQSKYYYIIGEVNTPGRFKVTGNELVLDAITQAGLKSNSLPEKAYLVRPHPLGGPDQVYMIDWCGIRDRGDTLTNYQIMPGDRVVVPGTRPPSVIRSLITN
jgi:polysaccharide export outer membrane protein